MFKLLHDKVLCIAHRGASSLAPENTLAAARKALELGADMWELDVSVTAEGELVVLHDDSLARTTNVRALYPQRSPWLISIFSLAEVQSLDAGSWFVETDPFGTITGGALSSAEQAAYRGEPIPTLAEALRFTGERQWRVNVEIKALTPPLENFPVAERVVALIEALGLVESVLLSSFEHGYLWQAKRLNPAIAVAALIDAGEAWPADWNRYDAIHPYAGSVDPAQVQAARRAGVAINPWTANDPAEMQRLSAAGVTGIFTDFPQRLLKLRG
ncbi:MAG: glycerophosphodiester phosphodiesterase family protein [Anaerolineae bacterium]